MGERQRPPRRRRHGAGHKVDALDRELATIALESEGAAPAELLINSTPYEEQLLIERDQLGGTDEEYYGWTGARVWEGSLILSKLADARGRDFWQDRRVVELGSGCGLGGITVAALGADTVLTDIVTQQAQANVTQTFGEQPPRAPAVRRLCWGDSRDMARVMADGGSFDVIIGSDILYNEASWPALLATIAALSRPGTEVMLVTVRRGGGSGSDEFLSLAARHHMLVEDQTQSHQMRQILESDAWRRQLGGSQPHALGYYRLVCTMPPRL
jgi:predicted nicotinamide N-methyase|eukprot:COSAG06_NODE_607_length_13867_cov_15.123112_7_plen_271_part_00